MAAIEHAERTNWQGVILSALVPMLVVIGFAYRALVSEGLPDLEGWVVGMFLLIPLEFIRALIISVLADAYKTGRNPLEVVQTFLISVAILLALCIGYVILEGGISDGLSLLASPYLYKFLGFPILIAVVDGIFGVLSFSGDPKLQAARLQAVADDSIDWLSVALFRLPFLILPAYGLLAWAGSAGLAFCCVGSCAQRGPGVPRCVALSRVLLPRQDLSHSVCADSAFRANPEAAPRRAVDAEGAPPLRRCEVRGP